MKIIDRKFLNVTTPSCHASTLAIFNNKPVYAWFGGSREGAPDVAIYVECEGKTYTIGDDKMMPYWNPILFTYLDKLYLFVKLGKFCDSWATIIYDISDILDPNFDIKKARYQILLAGLNGPVKTKPIDCGGLVYCGSSVETIIDWTSYCEIYKIKNGTFNYFDRSRPLVVPKEIYSDPYYGKRQTMGIIQMALYRDYNNEYSPLSAFFRSSRGLGKIYHSTSEINDFGRLMWSDPVPTNFPNPNSGVDCVSTKDNRLFLVYNPSEMFRYPLVINELDMKLNVIDSIVIQDKTDGKTNTEELSYPYLIENDGKLHLTYTFGRSRIEKVTLEI